MLPHNFTQCVCTEHAGIVHSQYIYIMNSCYVSSTYYYGVFKTTTQNVYTKAIMMYVVHKIMNKCQFITFKCLSTTFKASMK